MSTFPLRFSLPSLLPFLALTLAAPALAEAKIDFQKEVLPLLEKSCVDCHRAPYMENSVLKRPKGGLRLDASWAILDGGEGGAAIVPGDPGKSALYHRTTLPEDDDDFMPPKGTKWSAKDQKIVAAWIKEGADFGAWTGSTEGKPVKTSPATDVSWTQPHYESLAKDLSPASTESIAQVAAVGGRILPLAKDSPLLEVDFLVQRDETTGAQIPALTAIAGNLVHLDLSRTHITGDSLSHLKGMPRLTRLNLHSTQVDDAGLKHLSSLPSLTYLNLHSTPVTDAGLTHLASLKSLRNLYLWNTQVTPAGVKKLQQKLPGVEINLK